MKFVIESIGLTAGGGKELAIDLMTKLAGHTEHQFTCIVPDLSPYKAFFGSNIRTIACKTRAGLLQRARLLNYEVPRICRERKADALLCLGNFVPRKGVCPTVVLLHNPWIVYRDNVAEARRTHRENLITAYARHVYRHLSSDVTIVTQTPVMKEHLCGRYGIDPGRVAIIPNAFSLAKAEGNGDRTPSNGNGGARPFTFLCLTHYYAHKNIDFLIDAARKLPNYTDKSAKCAITIAPEQHAGARRLLERLDAGEAAGKIENIGPIPSGMLPQVYRNSDALIFPTLLESFSRTYLEAMYFGLPILTSDRDFAHHLCGDAAHYFDPLDADSVAKAMAALMEDHDLQVRLVENGRRTLEHALTWDEIAARFVEVLERRAKANPQRGEPLRKGLHAPQGHELTSVKRRGYTETTAANDVRTLFNHKARFWRSKYGASAKLHSRVEQFAVRLSEVCLPSSQILDLGCGTGDIAAAIGHRGYQVTACDFAEEMIDIARSSHNGTGVKWVCLKPVWEVLPFADGSFDGVVASSVFEYLVDVQRVAAELARVLRSEGVLLLTVPNPFSPVRKREALLQSILSNGRLSLMLRRIQRIDFYTTYLRLSRNRFGGEQWESVLAAAGFVAFDRRDFSKDTWREQATAPLVLLTVKRIARAQSGSGTI